MKFLKIPIMWFSFSYSCDLVMSNVETSIKDTSLKTDNQTDQKEPEKRRGLRR